MLHRKQLDWLESIAVNCDSCSWYGKDLCIKFKANPPPEVKAVGCDCWEYDSIPF